MLGLPPRSIRIAGKEWALKLISGYLKRTGLFGQCDYRASTLRVDGKLPDFDLQDTVLHEVMHAILYQQGHQSHGSAVEEKFVSNLATGLIGVFRDNPELARWITTNPNHEQHHACR